MMNEITKRLDELNLIPRNKQLWFTQCVDEAVSLLKEIEYGVLGCNYCEGLTHSSDCKLAAFIRKVEEENDATNRSN